MADWPEVTMADIFADDQFFDDHPKRHFRSRTSADGRVWLVRRYGQTTFLRTLGRSSSGYPDTDAALQKLWYEATGPVRTR